MSALRLRQAFPFILTLVMLLVASLLPVSIPAIDDFETPAPMPKVGQNEVPRPAGPISNGVTASEQFPITGTRIRSVALLLSTNGRANRGTAQITVQADTDGRWQDLTTQTLNANALQNDAYYTVSFSPPLRVEKGQLLRINLTTDGGANDAIFWETNVDWKPEGYALVYDGQMWDGTARFRVSYAPMSGRLFGMIGPLWARVTVFLDPLWCAVLIVGIGALIGSCAALGYALMR